MGERGALSTFLLILLDEQSEAVVPELRGLLFWDLTRVAEFLASGSSRRHVLFRRFSL